MLTGMILTDLQKAFDIIDHDALLQKLYDKYKTFCENILLIGLSLISLTHLFWFS